MLRTGHTRTASGRIPRAVAVCGAAERSHARVEPNYYKYGTVLGGGGGFEHLLIFSMYDLIYLI